MSVVPTVPANSPDPLDEQLLGRLRGALAFLRDVRPFATYEYACMSLAGAGGAVLANRLCPNMWLASGFLVLGLILLAGALVRTARRRARHKPRRRRQR
jgi:hypothetical protein